MYSRDLLVDTPTAFVAAKSCHCFDHLVSVLLAFAGCWVSAVTIVCSHRVNHKAVLLEVYFAPAVV